MKQGKTAPIFVATLPGQAWIYIECRELPYCLAWFLKLHNKGIHTFILSNKNNYGLRNIKRWVINYDIAP